MMAHGCWIFCSERERRAEAETSANLWSVVPSKKGNTSCYLLKRVRIRISICIQMIEACKGLTLWCKGDDTSHQFKPTGNGHALKEMLSLYPPTGDFTAIIGFKRDHLYPNSCLGGLYRVRGRFARAFWAKLTWMLSLDFCIHAISCAN